MRIRLIVRQHVPISVPGNESDVVEFAKHLEHRATVTTVRCPHRRVVALICAGTYGTVKYRTTQLGAVTPGWP